MTPYPFVIGIAGGSGSGKTTVARRLVENVGASTVPILSQDNYYHELTHLPVEQRREVNFDHPDSLDNDLLIRHVIDLKAGRPVHQPLYNYTLHTRRPETILVQPSPVIVIEGILVLVDARLRALMDMKIFVDIDPDVRLIRRLNRDVKERGRSLDTVLEQYLDTVRPMHLEFVEPSKRYADVIVPVGGQNTIAIEMISARIRAALDGEAPLPIAPPPLIGR